MIKKAGIFLALCIISYVAYRYYIKSQLKEPEFVSVNALELIELNNEKAKVKAVLVFHNPNTFSAKIINIQLKVQSDGIQIANLAQLHTAELEPKSNFELPIVFEVDLLKFGMSQGLSGLLAQTLETEKKFPLHFSGYCRIVTGKTNFRIPLEFDKTLRFQ